MTSLDSVLKNIPELNDNTRYTQEVIDSIIANSIDAVDIDTAEEHELIEEGDAQGGVNYYITPELSKGYKQLLILKIRIGLKEWYRDRLEGKAFSYKSDAISITGRDRQASLVGESIDRLIKDYEDKLFQYSDDVGVS